MRSTCSTRPARPASASRLGFAILSLFFAAPASAQPETAPCAVSGIAYAEADGIGAITVTLGCGRAGDEVPFDTDLLAGLTAYGPPIVEETLVLEEGDAPVPGPGGAERRIVNDSFVDYHDFPAQELRIHTQTGERDLIFEAPAEDLAARPFILFALWRGASREECDPTDEYGRQGCRDYGYVIGYDLWESLLLSYPGLTLVMTEDSAQFGGYEVERWVVERYK